jgi:hypothetical protein
VGAKWEVRSEPLEAVERAEEQSMWRWGHEMVLGVLQRDGDRRLAAKKLLEAVRSGRLPGDMAVRLALQFHLTDEIRSVALRGA